MKTIFQINSKKAYSIIVLMTSIVLLSLSSCLKDSGPDTGPIVSALSVTHASPNSPAFEFVLDNSIVDKRIPLFSYGKTIPLFSAFSGTRLARIYEADNFNIPLYETEIKLISGRYYSLFIAGEKDDLTSVLIEDDFMQPTPGKAKIRFVHLSADAPALDFKISEDYTLASDKKFKEYTGFQEIAAGNYNTVIKSHEGNSINFPIDLDLKEGKIYTIWAKGLVNTSIEEEEFGAGTILH